VDILKYNVKGQYFAVHFDIRELFIDFTVYPITEYWQREAHGFCYNIKGSCCEFLEVFAGDKAEIWFMGSFSWRGCWEGRLYFTKDEYWGDELLIMSELFEGTLVPHMKEVIKNKNPSYTYEES
jgi:hypothetical protein